MLALLLVGSHRCPRAPVPLVGMLLAAAAVAVLDLEDRGIAVVGEIPAGLPAPSLPSVSAADLASLLLPAVGVTIVAYSDNVLTARALRPATATPSTPTRSCSRSAPRTWRPV